MKARGQKQDDSVQVYRLQPTHHPMKAASLHQRDLTDGCVLHDRKTGVVCTLNSSASFILTFCTGEYSLMQIAEETASAFSLRRDDALRDVISMVQTLQNEGLLQHRSDGDRNVQNIL